MNDSKTKRAEPAREIVFVLRVRAGSDGWWGQLRKVDEQEPEYVRSTAHLLNLLEGHWRTAREADGGLPAN